MDNEPVFTLSIDGEPITDLDNEQSTFDTSRLVYDVEEGVSLLGPDGFLARLYPAERFEQYHDDQAHQLRITGAGQWIEATVMFYHLRRTSAPSIVLPYAVAALVPGTPPPTWRDV